MICLVPSNKFLFLLSFVVFDKIMNTRDCTTPLECLFKITHIPLCVSLFFHLLFNGNISKWKFSEALDCVNYFPELFKFLFIEMEKMKSNWIDISEEVEKYAIKIKWIWLYKSFWNHTEDNMSYFNLPKRQWFAHFMEYEIKFLIWSRGL